MSRLLLLLIALLLPASAAAKSDLRTVAVLPMTKGAGGPELDGFGAALADMMVTDLSTVAGLQLVERQRLNEVVAELELGESAFIDPKSAQELGHGLGAELLVMGSFSVVKETMVIDTRLVAVATGGVVKAARAEGEVADFVSIEKDVIESLVDGLEVELSRAERRQLLLQAPTEDFEAFASYGRGVKAKEEGNIDDARAAFEEALREDPDFDLAASELAQLAALVRRETEKESRRYKDARERSLYEGLDALTPETDRPADFVDTAESMLDFGLRAALLLHSKQHCTRFEELKRPLIHRDGELSVWFDVLPGAEHYDRYRAAEQVMDARAEELGLRGKETHWGTRPGEALHDAGSVLWSGPSLLLYRNMQPEKFSDTLIASMEKCFPPDERLAQWEAIVKASKKWTWLDEPLYRTYGEGPSTLTPRDSMDLYGALLRAESTGVDKHVTRVTEAVLARHPEGDGERRSVLNRIQTIVKAGERTEKRTANRYGMTADQLEGAVKAVGAKDASLIRMDSPLCTAIVEGQHRQVEGTLERYERDRNHHDVRRRQDAANQLGDLVGPLVLSGCFTDDPLDVEEVMPAVRDALKHSHPATLEDPTCSDMMTRLEEGFGQIPEGTWEMMDVSARAAYANMWLGQLHWLYANRCLVR